MRLPRWHLHGPSLVGTDGGHHRPQALLAHESIHHDCVRTHIWDEFRGIDLGCHRDSLLLPLPAGVRDRRGIATQLHYYERVLWLKEQRCSRGGGVRDARNWVDIRGNRSASGYCYLHECSSS